MTEWKCRYCSGNRMTAVVWYNQMLCVPDEQVGVYQCAGCGLMQRVELPDERACPEQMKSGEYTAGESVANLRMMGRLTFLERAYGKGLLLDIGAGTGSFVDSARAKGWEAVGVERPEFTKEHAHVLKVNIAVEDLPGNIPGSFHVLHMNHVLEHVKQIQKFLKACLVYLRPGGILIVEVPNEVRSMAIRIKRILGMKYLSRTAFLGHWNFFDKPALRTILDAEGLEILRLSTPAVLFSGAVVHRIFDRIQSCLGMGSVIEIVARKKA